MNYERCDIFLASTLASLVATSSMQICIQYQLSSGVSILTFFNVSLTRKLAKIMFTIFYVFNILCLQYFMLTIFHVYNILCVQYFMLTIFHAYAMILLELRSRFYTTKLFMLFSSMSINTARNTRLVELQRYDHCTVGTMLHLHKPHTLLHLYSTSHVNDYLTRHFAQYFSNCL